MKLWENSLKLNKQPALNGFGRKADSSGAASEADDFYVFMYDEDEKTRLAN
jgi:hypothetical protein